MCAPSISAIGVLRRRRDDRRSLSVSALSAWYGAARALFDVSLAVSPGEAVALLGRNGAGKSTTMRAILGLREATAGRDDASRAATFPHGPRTRSSISGLGYVPEDRRIFADLTTEENLEVGRQSAAARRPVLDARKTLRDLSESRRAEGSPGRQNVRRRAADAGDCAHADGKSFSIAARRALRGT